MTTFPRLLPVVGWADIDFRLERSVSHSRSGNRLTNIIEVADPLWMVTLKTGLIRRDPFTEVEAWWHSLRGGLRSVLFYHPAWPGPRSNRGNLAPAQTVGAVASITNSNTVSATGLNAGLVISRGDYVTFYNGYFHVAQVTDTSGAGTTRTIEFEPAFPPGSAFTGAGVYFDRINLYMRPVAGSFEKSGDTLFYQASFDLIETRLP
ncbi:hypothetical protein [Aurantimonas endophytica]|uniref:Uncharacterized protein n=1 Tax=Aurantimonas endophytica TaxID=1522175 RepID=A0A7W6H9B2_9HYPH|nr:hypothetical protein [Aurantimonas endophytica]MBB4000971.1 hypothetical protein [Aurantimonas endophytica]MCO6403370.1 hypothetical protein [Aurantimonas endophytica]